MVTREETTKMRKELMRAERILAAKEVPKKSKPNYMPMALKENKDRPEPKTKEVPNVIHLPKRKTPKKENVPFFF